MKISLSKRIVSFVLCLTVLLAGFAYKPQKAEAFAISASVVASVIMIMTACGVTFWASTQGDAESYISGKLGEYLDQLTPTPSSILDWLGITDLGSLFVVLTGGVARFNSNVANRIYEFVRWFNQDEGVVSGGTPVSDGGAIDFTVIRDSGITGDVTYSILSDNQVSFTFDSASSSSGSQRIYFRYPAPSGVSSATLTIDSASFSTAPYYLLFLSYDTEGAEYAYRRTRAIYYGTSLSSLSVPESGGDIAIAFELAYGQTVSGSVSLTLSSGDLVEPETVRISPSSSVSIPDDTSDDESYDVTPSVSLSEGMSVDDASSAVFDGATSADGLTSEGSTSQSGPLDWLSDILSAIHDLIAGIAQTVLGIPQAIGQAASDVITGVGNAISTALYNAFVPSEAAIDAFVATLAANFDNHFSILSYPFSLLGRFVLEVVDAPGAHELVWPDIYEPFSGQRLIAAGSYNLDNALANENFRAAYDIYMTVIKGYIAFQFIAYLYAWFCDVFRMRNDDFANPIFEQEPIDDGPDDWDGYDSFFET